MRIIAGSLGGRNFVSPSGNRTHPMSDKVRGALFNALGGIDGLTVLDAFAGSGALSFEAISRGAQQVVAVDPDKSAQLAIAQNSKSLGAAGRVKLIKAKVQAWLSTADQKFDIVLCDPPYGGVQADLLEKLAERAKEGGLVVLSLPPASDFKLGEGYQLVSDKNYGDASLYFYRKQTGG
jgi:16S rRNA (guanine966-N2)-methyltransferase